MVQNYKNDVILSVEHLKTYFYQKRNQEPIRAVDDVSFQIIRGSITAIVGQSGSGKSVTSMSIFNGFAGENCRRLYCFKRKKFIEIIKP